LRALIGYLILLSNAAFGEALLRVRPHVVVSPGSEVKLYQLVDAQGLSAESESVLRTTSMTRAPAYGERQELAQASLMEVLRPIIQRERAKAKSQVRLLLPSRVTIDTVKRELSAALVWEELRQVWQPLCSDCKLELEGLSLPAIQGVRDWTLRLKAELPRGSFSVPISIVRDDTAPVSAWISGRLIVKKKVPALKRAMNANERVQAGDFVWEYRDTSFATDGVPAAGEIVGRQVRQALRAGDPLWTNLLMQEKAVRRGDQVVARSSEQGWEVSMVLVAQQDAVVGDTINLKNPKTNNSLVGHVTGLGEVELR
jgi:flagella basal body P-ring formation protein FlgA